MQEWSGVAGKRVVITGATDGIGLVAAEQLAARGARLTLVARSRERAAAALERVRAHQAPGASAEAVFADLSVQDDVRAVAAELLDRHDRIDVLVNNAGAIFSRRRLTPDGIELTWALNHLAPFLLTALLLERLRESAPARIVTTASEAHRGRRLPPLGSEGEERHRAWRRYGQTKLANILFTRELARRLEGSDVTANCLHPGLVATGFNRNNGALISAAMTLVRPFARTPEEGARTLVWLVDSPQCGAWSGVYFADERPATPSAEAGDDDAARALWEYSRAQTGL